MDGDILEVLPNHMDQVILTDQDLLDLVAVVEQLLLNTLMFLV